MIFVRYKTPCKYIEIYKGIFISFSYIFSFRTSFQILFLIPILDKRYILPTTQNPTVNLNERGRN